MRYGLSPSFNTPTTFDPPASCCVVLFIDSEPILNLPIFATCMVRSVENKPDEADNVTVVSVDTDVASLKALFSGLTTMYRPKSQNKANWYVLYRPHEG